MKRILALFLCAVLIIGSPAAFADEESPQSFDEYLPSDVSVLELLEGVEQALDDGLDRETVLNGMNAWAEEHGLADSLACICENIAAYDNETYRKITEYEGRMAQTGLPQNMSPYEKLDEEGGTVYDNLPVSDAVRDLLADSGAQFCFTPFCWFESGFQEVFGTDFNHFRPSNPRPGYVCVVLSKDSQPAPEEKLDDTDPSSAEEILDNAVNHSVRDLLYFLEEDAPVLTGNPNLASEFWIVTVKYPFYASYGSSGEVKGYNCTLSLNAMNAASKAAVAALSAKSTLPNTIYSWSNWIAKADIPVLEEEAGYEAFAEKLRAAAGKERSVASAEKRITAFNAGSVLNGILNQQADKAYSQWEKAIYESGAENVSYSADELTFSLRSYKADPSVIGTWEDPTDQRGLIEAILLPMTDYNLDFSLPLQEGKPTAAGLNALKSAVSKTAAEAKRLLAGRDVTTLLSGYLFPSVTDGTVSQAAQLKEPSEAFRSRIQSDELFMGAPLEAWAALFYGQGKQAVNLEGGPHTVTLTAASVSSEDLLKKAQQSVLDIQAYLPSEERAQSLTELESALLDQLADSAFALKKSAGKKTTLTIDLDDLAEGEIPGEYRDWVSCFDYESCLDDLWDSFELFPDCAAVELPRTGWISGSTGGTTVIFKIAADNRPTYIQMRENESDELTVSAFVRPGQQATLYVPAGMYTIRWCSGPYWYGEEVLFGRAGSYQKSEPLEIKSRGYCHTFTLESVADGDISIHGADPEDFR